MLNIRQNLKKWCAFTFIFVVAAVCIYEGLTEDIPTSRLTFGIVLAVIGIALLILQLFGPDE
jgi:hypothetical protein